VPIGHRPATFWFDTMAGLHGLGFFPSHFEDTAFRFCAASARIASHDQRHRGDSDLGTLPSGKAVGEFEKGPWTAAQLAGGGALSQRRDD